jgi:hypothetical protein
MTSIWQLSLVVAIVGLLMFCLSKAPSGKPIEIGKIMFFVGLLAFLLTSGPLLLFFRH